MVGRPGTRRAEVVCFWQRLGQGASVRQAAESMGYRGSWGRKLVLQAGGVRPRLVGSGCYLTFDRAGGDRAGAGRPGLGGVQIARRLGCSPVHGQPGARRANCRGGPAAATGPLAQAKADDRARRPKTAKLAAQPRLRELRGQDKLGAAVEPGADRARMRLDFPDDEGMRISHETIYQSLYVQGRGALRRELTACLRTGPGAAPAPRAAATARRDADPEQGDDQRTSRRGRRPGRARPLGRRPDHRQERQAPRSAPWSSAPPAT